MGSEFVLFFSLCCRLAAVPVVAPSNIGGGGGTDRELTITWTVGLDFPAGRGERGERVSRFRAEKSVRA